MPEVSKITENEIDNENKNSSMVTITATIPSNYRSATANYGQLKYEVIAKAKDSTLEINKEFENSTFSVSLIDNYTWDITINAKNSQNILFFGTKTINPKTATSMLIPLKLFTNYSEGQKGSLKLPVNYPSAINPTYSVEFINKSKDATYSGTSTISNIENEIFSGIIEPIEDLNPGTYGLNISIFDKGFFVYFLRTDITIFPGLETNLWKNEIGVNDDNELELTSEILEEFKYSTLFVKGEYSTSFPEKSENGNDLNLGTVYSPLKTISAAVKKCENSTKEYTIFVDGEFTEANTISIQGKKITINSLKESNQAKIKSVNFEVNSNNQLDLQNINFASNVKINGGKFTFNDKTKFSDQITIILEDFETELFTLSHDLNLISTDLIIKSQENRQNFDFGTKKITIDENSSLDLQLLDLSGTDPSTLKGNIYSKGELLIKNSKIDCSIELDNSQFSIDDSSQYKNFYLNKATIKDNSTDSNIMVFNNPIKFISTNTTEKSEIKIKNRFSFCDSLEMDGITIGKVGAEENPEIVSQKSTSLKNCIFNVNTILQEKISFDEKTIFNKDITFKLLDNTLNIPSDFTVKGNLIIEGNEADLRQNSLLIGTNKIIVDENATALFNYLVINQNEDGEYSDVNIESKGNSLTFNNSSFKGTIKNSEDGDLIFTNTTFFAGTIENLGTGELTFKETSVNNGIIKINNTNIKIREDYSNSFSDCEFILKDANIIFSDISEDDSEIIINDNITITGSNESVSQPKLIIENESKKLILKKDLSLKNIEFTGVMKFDSGVLNFDDKTKFEENVEFILAIPSGDDFSGWNIPNDINLVNTQLKINSSLNNKLKLVNKKISVDSDSSLILQGVIINSTEKKEIINSSGTLTLDANTKINEQNKIVSSGDFIVDKNSEIKCEIELINKDFTFKNGNQNSFKNSTFILNNSNIVFDFDGIESEYVDINSSIIFNGISDDETKQTFTIPTGKNIRLFGEVEFNDLIINGSIETKKPLIIKNSIINGNITVDSSGELTISDSQINKNITLSTLTNSDKLVLKDKITFGNEDSGIIPELVTNNEKIYCTELTDLVFNTIPILKITDDTSDTKYIKVSTENELYKKLQAYLKLQSSSGSDLLAKQLSLNDGWLVIKDRPSPSIYTIDKVEFSCNKITEGDNTGKYKIEVTAKDGSGNPIEGVENIIESLGVRCTQGVSTVYSGTIEKGEEGFIFALSILEGIETQVIIMVTINGIPYSSMTTLSE